LTGFRHSLISRNQNPRSAADIPVFYYCEDAVKLKKVICAFCFTVCLFAAQAAFCLPPEESLKNNFPKIKVKTINPTQINGIYEVVTTTGEIIYYSPQAECVISGNIFTKDMKNITYERKMELLAQKMKKVPMEKAIKVGNGTTSVIEFTDPDCPYCRKAFDFFSKRTDVTEYIFFLPLPMHPNAKDKARYVLCSKDRAKAFKEAMSGKLDDMKFKKCKDTKAADEIIGNYESIAREAGIRGTPFFFIKGQVITGANIPAIEKILGNEK
jgi:thiol:disulfide interchange protein DsbC